MDVLKDTERHEKHFEVTNTLLQQTATLKAPPCDLNINNICFLGYLFSFFCDKLFFIKQFEHYITTIPPLSCH